jgi:hypothetical protein
MVGYLPLLLETSKTPKNGEKNFFFSVFFFQKIFFPRFFWVFEVSNNGVDTRPCKYVTQIFFFLVGVKEKIVFFFYFSNLTTACLTSPRKLQ